MGELKRDYSAPKIPEWSVKATRERVMRGLRQKSCVNLELAKFDQLSMGLPAFFNSDKVVTHGVFDPGSR